MRAWSCRLGIVSGICFVLGSSLATEARASVTFYTDRAAFEAAAMNVSTLTFESIAAPNDFRDFSTTGFTRLGMTFQSRLLYVVDAAYTPEFYDWGSGAVLSGQTDVTGASVSIDVSLPTGTTAFGTDIMTFLPYAQPVTMLLSSGDRTTAPTNPYPDRAFVGFISTDPISSLSLGSSTNLNLDNVSILSTSVPEPPAGLLLLLGLTGMVTFVSIRRMAERLGQGARRLET